MGHYSHIFEIVQKKTATCCWLADLLPFLFLLLFVLLSCCCCLYPMHGTALKIILINVTLFVFLLFLLVLSLTQKALLFICAFVIITCI